MVTSKPHFLTIILVVVTITATTINTAVGGSHGQFVYGRTKVENVKTNKEVQNLGRFAVGEYNRRQEEARNERIKAGLPVPRPLAFKEVLEAERYIADKRIKVIEFYLKITANTGEYDMQFASDVIVKPWENSKFMVRFERWDRE